MVDVEFSSTAFLALETLLQHIGFGIVALSDHLRANPAKGKVVNIKHAPPGQYRLLIYRGTHRLVYEYVEDDNFLFVGAVQDCRQKLPDARQLKRDHPPDEELPLE